MSKRFFVKHRSFNTLLVAATLVLLLSGCTAWIKTEQSAVVDWVRLSAEQSIGQTFVAKYDGLTGIYFYLSPKGTGKGEIRLHLRSDAQIDNDLAESINSLAIDAVKSAGYYGFFVPSQKSSNGTYYYAVLEVTGKGDVQVGRTNGDAYLNGALYQNGTPEDGQTAFQLSYSRRVLIPGLGREALNWAAILALGIFLFILPGWGILSILWTGWGGFTWPEKTGLAAGLSIALYPIIFLWTDIIDLHLGAIYAWLLPLTGLGIILWRNRKWVIAGRSKNEKKVVLVWADLVFIGLMVLIVFTRFWSIRSLDVPMWGDSYHHTMIAQLLADNGGLFKSWQPYAELTTFTYHFGFHSAAAVFYWITHMDMSKSVLWVGQLMNVLAIVVLYPLAKKVGHSEWAGVAAVLVGGLLSPLPMYYVNWGRYTQLAGQVIMPAAIYFTWIALESEQRGSETSFSNTKSNWLQKLFRNELEIGRMAVLWILLGGLALTHYRILIFAIIFFVMFIVIYGRRLTWRNMLTRTFWIGTGAGLLFLPWFVRTFSGRIILFFASQISTPVSTASNWAHEYNAIGDISSYLPIWLWLLWPISILWSLWRREKGVLLISLWSFSILLVANPQWLRLPGEGLLNNFAVFIAAYIPASVVAGYLLGRVTSIKTKNGIPSMSSLLILVISLLIFAAGLSGVRDRMVDLQVAGHELVTRPDIRAAVWIRENTPQAARFLVNSFFAYGNMDIVGSDGGWWLPLLAKRQTSLPPLSYDSEQGPRPDYISWINDLTAEIQNKGLTNPEVLRLLRERGIDYLFIGQRHGRVNYSGPYVFDPQQLLGNPEFRVVYHQDRVWVFEILVH